MTIKRFITLKRREIELAIKAVLLILLYVFVVRPFHVTGPSMLPALENGQLLLVERVSYYLRAPRPGEVVVFYVPSRGVSLIKRVDHLSEDGVYVLGDNAAQSNDSRNFGAVPRRYVTGRALCCYWPPRHWGRVR